MTLTAEAVFSSRLSELAHGRSGEKAQRMRLLGRQALSQTPHRATISPLAPKKFAGFFGGQKRPDQLGLRPWGCRPGRFGSDRNKDAKNRAGVRGSEPPLSRAPRKRPAPSKASAKERESPEKKEPLRQG